MVSKYLSFLVLFFSIFSFSQNYGKGKMTELQQQKITEFLKENKVPIKDSIFIKYDYDKETCWDNLDGMSKKYILKVLENFQKKISNFNAKHPNAVAVNFREPGENINKLKLWDSTILVDEKLFLKKLMFAKNERCGNSVLVLKDGSVTYNFGDPHFEILEISEKKLPHKF